MIPTEQELAVAIKSATQRAVTALFRKQTENFYYLSLITTGEAHAPFLAAWSTEALNDAVKRHPSDSQARQRLKWSYADSPYMGFGEEYFDEVRHLFSLRPKMSATMTIEDWMQEYAIRIRAMETAMKRLDDDGLFGVGQRRFLIVVNVEVMPPDHTNTERACHLNPPAALVSWMQDAAETL